MREVSVKQLTLGGELVTTYASMEAASVATGINRTAIAKAVSSNPKQRRKSAGGFKWETEDTPAEPRAYKTKWGSEGNWKYSIQKTDEDFDKLVTDAVDRFKSIVADLKVKAVVLPKVKPAEARCLNVYLADEHVGSDIRNPIFHKEYNSVHHASRVSEAVSKVNELRNLYGIFDQINIICLGDGVDGVDGQTARKGHTLDQNLETTEQFDHYVKNHTKMMDSLVALKAAKNLAYIVCTNDNHNGYFQYLCSRGVEVYLNAKYPQIRTRIEKAFIFHETYGDNVWILMHGKDDRHLKVGFPKVLSPDKEKYLNEYIDFHGLSKNIPYDLQCIRISVIKGDLHTSCEEYAKRFRYKNIMALSPASSYIQHNYGAGYSGFEWEIVHKNTTSVVAGKHFYPRT